MVVIISENADPLGFTCTVSQKDIEYSDFFSKKLELCAPKIIVSEKDLKIIHTKIG